MERKKAVHKNDPVQKLNERTDFPTWKRKRVDGVF